MAVYERGEVTRLFVYPLKSAGAVETNALHVTQSGVAIFTGSHFINDREFMFVWAKPDADGAHNMLTQRGSVREGSGRLEDRGQTLSKLATIRPQSLDGKLILNADPLEPLEIPLDLKEGERYPVKIHKKRYENATRLGPQYDEWASDFVGAPVMVMRAVDATFNRPVRQDYLKNRTKLRFQDGFQIHVIPEEAITQLMGKMLKFAYDNSDKLSPSVDVPNWESLMRSFRPNVLVKDLSLDNFYQIWKARLGEIGCAHPKPCDRCTMPKVNQASGEIGKIDPVRILNEYMHWKDLYGAPATIFGINFIPRAEGVVHPQDPIEITHMRRGKNRIEYGPAPKKLIA